MIWNKFHTEKYSHINSLLFFLICLPFLNGCATINLWDREEAAKVVSKIRAEADQIYLLYDKTDRGEVLNRKYCVPYQIRENGELKGNKAGFPENTKGCLIFQEKEYYFGDAEDFDKEIESIYKNSAEWDIISLYAIKIEDHPERCQLNIAFIKLPSFEKKTSDNVISKVFQRYFKRLDYLPPFERLLPSDRTEIYDRSVYSYSFGKEGKMRFLKEIDTSEWKAILDQKKCPFPIDFYAMKFKHVYRVPFPIVILATPLALAFDIVSFPIQLPLLYILWPACFTP